MRTLMLCGLLAFAAITLNSCSQNAVSPDTTAASARASSTTAVSSTTANTEVVITQDKLPAAVLTYLTTNYAGYTFVQAEQGTDAKGATYYEVQFTLNGVTKELHFDAAGAIQSTGKGGHGGNAGGSGNTEVVITQDKLPAAALTYLTTNYAGYTFVQAEQGTDAKGVTYYEVQFTFNGVTKDLHFDAAGAIQKG